MSSYHSCPWRWFEPDFIFLNFIGINIVNLSVAILNTSSDLGREGKVTIKYFINCNNFFSGPTSAFVI